MNCFEEYINYLKDNPEGHWFKRKLYGYGWTPARKEGWLTLAIYLVLVFGIIIFSNSNKDLMTATNIVSLVTVVTLIFLLICFKTGESLKWQWGKDKINE
jgi:hypothetical protein